ncbi:THAP9 [Mytilus edulis]|uniref:THAP9 n=1 Tax=Mytilus edulis TaxID=6550 RepID=A0A8S3TMF4_MYTED|nr:THAP9 [Mytilus edulis]
MCTNVSGIILSDVYRHSICHLQLTTVQGQCEIEKYDILYEALRCSLPAPYILNSTRSVIQILSFYNNSEKSVINSNICRNFKVNISIHQIAVSAAHEIWEGMHSSFTYAKDNTVELIGYVNIDYVGNQIPEIEKLTNNTSSKLAKFMLVLMVRGVTTSLKFPFAAFATTNITADFLYPIIWKAVQILESFVKLKVLFLTCDGPSNRRFFNLHRLNDELVYYTVNPHDTSRNLYFVSDVPHLLKTTRNCFINSQSNKNTRPFWKDRKDISRLHLVRLFEELCELDLYNPCSKLTRGHIDMKAFSYMNFNLEAHI